MGLILLVAGAVIPFVLSIYEKISEKKKTRVILILISTGFIITLCSTLLVNIQESNRIKMLDGLEEKKKEMISTISKNVSDNLAVSNKSLNLLEGLKSRLDGISISEVAVELTPPDDGQISIFEKGSPQRINDYVKWLEQVKEHSPGKKSAPALSLMLNTGRRNYITELILAFLLADIQNISLIEERLGRNKSEWREFPDEATIKELGRLRSGLAYVLFFNKSSDHLMGFANATEFAQELLLLKQQGKSKDIENMFNRQSLTDAEKMKKYFTSFKSMVFPFENPYDAARELIEQKENEAVIFNKKKQWFISLANVIKLAT